MMRRFALMLMGLGLLIFANPAFPEGSNLMVNGGFEAGVQDNGVGDAWSPFANPGYEATYDVVADPVYDGLYAQQIMAPQPSSTDQYAGIYQRVATEPEVEYTLRAWNRTYFPGGHAYDHIARLGIDLTGGDLRLPKQTPGGRIVGVQGHGNFGVFDCPLWLLLLQVARSQCEPQTRRVAAAGEHGLQPVQHDR